MKGPSSAIPQQWAWHHQTLLQLRETLLREHNARSTAARAPHHRAVDSAEIASEKSNHDELLAELSHEESQLAEVEAALERLRNGTYGLCEVTGEPISATRLRAVPWTRFSQPVAQRREQRRVIADFLKI